MTGFDFDGSHFFNHLDFKEKRVLDAAKVSMQDSLDDLKRISSEIAPIDESILRKSVNTELMFEDGGIAGEVSFSAIEKSKSGRRFNYALWTHEMEYELGERSRASPGTDGYAVGNKYLERPLKGETNKYVEWWAKAIRREMDG